MHAMKDAPSKILEVTLTTSENKALLVIGDTGAGMSEEVKEHLFEPFFTTKPIGEGTGLGLATCHGIVLNHRGEIKVESEPGKGTRFILIFPLAEPEPASAVA